jgi:hypothetical protein
LARHPRVWLLEDLGLVLAVGLARHILAHWLLGVILGKNLTSHGLALLLIRE